MYAVGDAGCRRARPSPGTGEYRRVDAGPDFYAPQTLTDETGRTIMIGWMGMPDHDGQPTLAEKHPTVANGWVHCLTVPRELSLDGDQLRAMAGRGAHRPARRGRDPRRASRSSPARHPRCSTVSPAPRWTWT